MLCFHNDKRQAKAKGKRLTKKRRRIYYKGVDSNLRPFKMYKGWVDENEAQMNLMRKLVKVRIATAKEKSME